MRQNADNFIALGRLADFVQLVKVDYRVAGFAAHENVHDFPPHAALVRVGVSLQEAAVSCTSERNELKVTPQNLADAFLDQRRLSRAGWSVNGNRRANCGGVCDPLPDHLHDLHFGVVQAVDCRVQPGFGGGHKLVAAVHTVCYRDWQIFVSVEGDLHEGVHPVLQLAVLAAAGLHVLQHANLAQCNRLHGAWNIGFQQRELIWLHNFGHLGHRVHFLNHGALFRQREVLLEVFQVIGGAFSAQQFAKLLGILVLLSVRECVQLLLDFFLGFFERLELLCNNAVGFVLDEQFFVRCAQRLQHFHFRRVLLLQLFQFLGVVITAVR